MTAEQLKNIIAQGESMTVEFKESKKSLSRSVYETICAFLNRKGGHILLGVKDDKTIIGVNEDSVKTQLDTLAKDLNNPQIMDPVVTAHFDPVTIDGKIVIYGYIQESAYGHMHKGEFYDRNQDGDFKLKTTFQKGELFMRKSGIRTEEWVYPHISVDDLDNEAFEIFRNGIRANKNPDHEILDCTNDEILHRLNFYKIDPKTGQQGLTLASILLFGKESAIKDVAPYYRIDVLCRIHDTEWYDDRLVIESNLMGAYGKIMEFVAKYLPEQPAMDGIYRFSLRDKILREVVLNMLIHTEYSTMSPSSFTIGRHSVVAKNWNRPVLYGKLNLTNYEPVRKNPLIASAFIHMGIVEALGSGMQTIYHWTPKYSGGKQPEVDDNDFFSILIPYQSVLYNESGKIVDIKDDADSNQEVNTHDIIEGVLKSVLKSVLITLPKKSSEILELIYDNPIISMPEIGEKVGLSRTAVANNLKKLQEAGLLKRHGATKGGHWEVVIS